MDAGTPPPSKGGEPKPPGDETKPPVDATKPPADATKPTEEPPKPVKAAELRQAYDTLKKKMAEAEPELQRLRAKVQEFEGRQDPAPLLDKIKALEGTVQRLEQDLEFENFSKSPRFSKEYDQPYQSAWAEAVSEFRELTVRELAGEDETTGEPKYNNRPATEQDLIKLGSMTLSEMDEAAQKMFGASASRAIGHIANLRKLSAKRAQALEDAQKRTGEFVAQQKAEHQAKSQSMANAWKQVNQSLEERFPGAFKPAEGDEVDRAAHTKGFALANLMFMGEDSLTPEQIEALPAMFKEAVKAKRPLNDEERVRLHALARLKMANHDRQIIRLKNTQDRIAELEKELAEFRKSEPGGGKISDGSGAGNKDWLETAEDELKALDRKG